MKKLFLFFILSVCYGTIFSQNITNTLGSGGSFIINDGRTSILSLDQATGHLSLNSIMIFKGADSFLHNFGTQNTFLGINSGNFTMTGAGNSALGQSTLYNNTTGYNNTAMGDLALYSNTTGIWNAALGYGSLYSNTIGSYNTALGYLSLQTNNSGSNNTALGYGSLYVNTTGDANTALGNWALSANITGTYNTALGYQSLYSNTDGTNNTSSGYKSLYSNTSGSYNTASGYLSLYSNTTGVTNSAFGYGAGSDITVGHNLTCLGWKAEPSANNAANELTLGNGDITSLRCAVTGITSLSDKRDKKNIRDLNLGIDFLMKIKPRQFNWDKREWYENNKSDGSKMKEVPTDWLYCTRTRSSTNKRKSRMAKPSIKR